MKAVTRGIVALILVSAILLISDLKNRRENTRTSYYKLSFVQYIDNPFSEECEEGLRKALEDHNLIEGVNFTMKVFNAQGDIATLNSIAGSLENEKWDLIFTSSTPTIQLLSKKLQGRKIVFTNVGDPIIAGLGNSFEDHLPDITGIATMSDFDGLVKLVLSLQPGVRRIGTVFTPSEINSVSYKDHLEIAAKAKGLQLVAVPASTVTEVMDAANSLVAQKIDAICQITDNLTGSCGSVIIKVARDSKTPFYGFITKQLEQGAVAVCARDYYQAGYEAGQTGIEVLSGKDPGRIPFRLVSKTDYLISRSNAAFFKLRVDEKIKSEFPTLVITD